MDLLGLDRLTRCSALELGYLWIGFPALRAASGCNLIFHKGGTLRSPKRSLPKAQGRLQGGLEVTLTGLKGPLRGLRSPKGGP